MRILFISNFKKNGFGESTRPVYLAENMKALGHQVLLVSDWEGKRNGCKHVLKPKQDTSRWDFGRIAATLNMTWNIWWFRPEIIYVHQLNNWTWFRLSNIMPKATTVFDAHTSLFFEFRHFGADPKGLSVTYGREKNAVTEANHVITVSEDTKAMLMANYPLNELQVTVVRNATHIAPKNYVGGQVARNQFICSSILPQDGFVSNEKALKMALEIAEKAKESLPNVVFRIIGGGILPSSAPDNVVFTGFVNQLEDELSLADICLLTYPEDAVCGGVRNKTCDYMATGKPILTTTEGMRGFEDCVSGREYLSAETVDEFIMKIRLLIEDESLRERLSKAAYAKSFEYQWSNRAKEVLSTFEKLLVQQESRV